MYVKVRVVSGVKKEKVTKEKEHQFNIEVKERALRNLANTRVRTLIAREYGVQISAARIIRGHRSSSKIISID